MRSLKVYGDSSGFSRKIVAARTKKRAMELMGVKAYHFNQFVAVTGNRREVLLACRTPEQVYVQPHRGPCKGQWLRFPDDLPPSLVYVWLGPKEILDEARKEGKRW